MKVFSKAKYCEGRRRDAYIAPWVDECDGKPVVNGKIDYYFIEDDWCIEKEDEPMQKYTMKDFIEKKIVVHCTNDYEKRAFLKMCEDLDLRWVAGSEATKFIPCSTVINEEPVKITCGFDTNDKRGRSLTWGDADDHWYIKLGWTVVPFAAITNETTPTYEIHIKCVGDVTTAEMVVNGKVVKSSKAKRDPRDKFSFKTGAEYAFNRLFEKKEKEVKTPKNGIKSRDGFTIGNRVVSTCRVGNNRVSHQYGRVIGFSDSGTLILVEFDDDVRGHTYPIGYDESLLVKKGHNWWCFPNQIERV